MKLTSFAWPRCGNLHDQRIINTLLVLPLTKNSLEIAFSLEILLTTKVLVWLYGADCGCYHQGVDVTVRCWLWMLPPRCWCDCAVLIVDATTKVLVWLCGAACSWDVVPLSSEWRKASFKSSRKRTAHPSPDTRKLSWWIFWKFTSLSFKIRITIQTSHICVVNFHGSKVLLPDNHDLQGSVIQWDMEHHCRNRLCG